MARRSAPRVNTTSRLLQRIWPGVRSTGSCKTTENGEGKVSKADRLFHALADTKQQGGVRMWEDSAGKMTRGDMERIQPKIIPSPGAERNDLLAAHCPYFNLCYLKTLQGITKASSKAHSQCSCPVSCQRGDRGERAALISSGPGSPALL